MNILAWVFLKCINWCFLSTWPSWLSKKSFISIDRNLTSSWKEISLWVNLKKLNLINGFLSRVGKILINLFQLALSTKELSMIWKKMKRNGKFGMILKNLKVKSFLKASINWLHSKSLWSSESSDPIELWTEWKGSLLMHTKMINLCNLQQSTMKRFSSQVMKNHQLCLSFRLELIPSLMFKNWLMTKDFLEISSNIFHLDRVWRKKLIYIFQLHLTEDTGSCFKIAICWLLGSKIILKNSWRLFKDPTKTLDCGSQPSQLKLSLWVSFKRPWK